jgi:16S rRNA (cytosine1402-N4)-methyltransferase
MSFAHVPVLVREIIEYLRPETGKRYLDGTLGGGGHAEAILDASRPSGRLLGLDRDDHAIAAARERLSRFKDNVTIRQESFAAAKDILAEMNWHKVDGVILDLGISSHQLDAPERGFSFQSRARLDMRMDQRQSLTAFDIINEFSAPQITKILYDYGEEPSARRIATAIIAERKKQKIETTTELSQIVERIKGRRPGGRHPATQTFQALRIAVNDELGSLKRFLEGGFDLLVPGGRMAIVSFHSLEDRLVKTAFRRWHQSCLCPPRSLRCECGWSQKVKQLTKRPVVPSPAEVAANPRARSAKLRAVVRL